jgi:hypothetical protein
MEVLREIDLFIEDRLAFNRKVIGRVERIDKDVDILAGKFVLFEPVRKTLDMARPEKPVHAVDDLPLKIAHWLFIERLLQKTIW